MTLDLTQIERMAIWGKVIEAFPTGWCPNQPEFSPQICD